MAGKAPAGNALFRMREAPKVTASQDSRNRFLAQRGAGSGAAATPARAPVPTGGDKAAAAQHSRPRPTASSAAANANPPTVGGHPSVSAGQSAFARKFDFLKQSTHYQPPPDAPAPPATEGAPRAAADALSAAGRTPPVSGSVPARGPSSGAAAATTVQSTRRAPTGTNNIVVSTRQRGNPLLKAIRNVSWEFGDVVPDFILGQTTCALFLSIRYHNLHPDYVHARIRELGRHFRLRVLLTLVDVKDSDVALQDLSRLCISQGMTLMVAWSNQEAGRYLETFKVYEHKPADMLKERVAQTHLAQLTSALTSSRAVNKTDVVTLVSTFGSLKEIANASREETLLCPGFGESKVDKLHDLLNEPFIRPGSARHRAMVAQAKAPKAHTAAQGEASVGVAAGPDEGDPGTLSGAGEDSGPLERQAGGPGGESSEQATVDVDAETQETGESEPMVTLADAGQEGEEAMAGSPDIGVGP